MSNITLTIPNDDHIALRAFGKALEEMALAHGAEPRKTIGEMTYKLNIDTSEATAALERLRTTAEEFQPEVDTTSQQVESLAVPVEANGATYETNLSSDNPQPVPVADSTGTPWDERIHSASKALNADGTWRLRRKPRDMGEAQWAAFVETVKAELSEGLETPAEAYLTDDFVKPPVTHQNPVYMYQESCNVYALGRSEEEIAEYETKGYVRHTQEQYDAWEGPTVADEGDDFHTDADVVTEQIVAGIPPLPVPPPVVVAPEVTEWDFPRLMTFLTERHGKIDVATVNTLLVQDGMLSVQELNAHPDKIGPFVARVKAHLGE
ncbi:hypothetical protein M12a_00012 [Klebsiella phage VLCpiM12a]|uniref:hypothetical protein n=1 Tax=Klebsiella phage VLCpiM12a TaxID=2874879 RepID=UPI00232AA1A4|nr:hypothetical protein PQZ58_gp12 [Klebsiella phage VLCpiM12a]UVX31523.1 hypothetical protein M12a_00012 [Klebsiella phage VLCpiM12a]